MQNGLKVFNRAGLFRIADQKGGCSIGKLFDEKTVSVNPSGDAEKRRVADCCADTINETSGCLKLFNGHGLFSVGVGLGGDGENKVENEMGFVTVTVVGNGD